MTSQLDHASSAFTAPPKPQEKGKTSSFESRDPTMVQAHLEGLIGPHVMDLPYGERGFEAHQHGGDVRGVGVHRLTYGAAAVDVTPEPVDDRILVLRPLSGNVGVSSGAVGVVSSARLPAVLDAGEQYKVHWSSRSVVQKVSFDRDMATEVAADLHGLSTGQVKVKFGLHAPVSPRAVVAWSRMADLLAEQLFLGGANELGPLAQVQLARAAMAALLDAYPEAIHVQPADEKSGWVAHRTIDRAVRYMEENAQYAIQLRDIANDAGLSPRALQLAFRRHYDITPMAFLRDIRLHRAHSDLLAADPEVTTVAAVAAKWGFFNPGRFASEFREEFAQYPKSVLGTR